MLRSTPHRRRALVLLGAAALAWHGAEAQTSGERPAYTVAVVPQFPAAEIHRDWVPLLEQVGREAGVTLNLKLAASIPRFEAEVLAGTPDFAFMNPYHAVMAMRAQGYIPLVRDSKLLSGVLVVRKDDPIKSVQELDGKQIAFPAPNAFGASLWMRALLAEREHIHFKPVYVQTHGNVYRQVVRGTSAAGGGINSTLQQEREELRSDLRVLMETTGVAPHPLSAHPRVPPAVQRAVADALMRLSTDAKGQALMKEASMPAPVRADYARDYRPLEQFKLDKYVVVEPSP
jgi:phosphonate transport system substrate-binding protein